MRRHKVIKRILLSIAAVLALTAAVSYWAFKGTPDFYRPSTLTAEERAEAADRAMNKLIETRNWAAKLRADEQRAIHAQASGTTLPATNPAEPFTVSFTEQELNAFFENWSKTYGWDARYERYFSNPALVLRKDSVILAGTLPELGAVASFHFRPAIDAQGQLALSLGRVYAGRLPMPEMVWTAQRERLMASVQQRLPAWQQNAKISPNGTPNNDAVAAAMSKLLLDVFNHRPGDATVFLPDPVENAAVPVRITAIRVLDEEVTLTVAPMTPAERSALLDRIREPEPTATASVQ